MAYKCLNIRSPDVTLICYFGFRLLGELVLRAHGHDGSWSALSPITVDALLDRIPVHRRLFTF